MASFETASRNGITLNHRSSTAIWRSKSSAQTCSAINGSGSGANAALARKHGLRLLGYEGGAHDTSGHFPAAHQEAVAALFAAAHRHPRMRAVYDEYLELWIASGGDMLAHYNDIGRWSKYGQWGALEYVTQDPAEAPKYRALLDVIARHPRS